MEFRALGPVEAADERGRIALGGPQQRRLLAVLLCDPGRVLSHERLLDVLWHDGEPPENARRTAISYVSRLRTALGEGWVSTKDGGYRLDVSGASVDADRFMTLVESARSLPPERAVDVLDEALVLWRGPVFGEFAHEWWALGFTSRLEELRLTALADRLDALMAARWTARAVAEAQTAVASHPLRPQLVDRLMRVLHAQGRTDEALRAFQTHRDALVEQTGLDPSPDLVALERSIALGSTPIDDVAVGRSLRGYVLRDVLGSGSFGTVYRATQPSLGRDVAVKVINPELADDRSFIHRFEAEAQLVARLEHASIVPLYDYWREPGGAFLVFRLLRGGSAADVLGRDGAISIERATQVVQQIGGALAVAHAAGVVHRDVKPANVLFDDEGQAYLADFGIAVGGDEALTGTAPASMARWSAGSPMYASPEQLRDGSTDARADQYALAVTMWHLITGRAPFDGDDVATVLTAKLLGPLSSRSTGAAVVPDRLAAVLARATAVHPDDRFEDMASFVAAWHSAVASASVNDTDRGRQPELATVGVGVTTAEDVAAVFPNPYKGLRPFREADAGDFFGRTSVSEQLAAMVKDHGFAAVVGPSGSGKSSVVLAGLVPALRSNGALVITMTPGPDPFEALSRALVELATADSAALVTAANLRRSDGVAAAAVSVAAGEELVIVVDQLEELWTLTDPDDCVRFTEVLAQLSELALVKLVVTIRADWFDRPLRDANLGPLVSRSTYGVTAMSASELEASIIGPAGRLGVRFEPGLVGRIVAETQDQPGSLPLLQFALTELYEQRDGATITSAGYDEMGGLAGAVAHQAESIYESFDPAEQAAVRRMFARLVTAGDGSEDTRRRAMLGELVGVGPAVVDAFVARRLLTLDRDRQSREPTVEVAHEALLRSWPRLRTWLDEDRDWVRELRGISAATALWSAAGRSDADLYRGARLAVSTELAVDRTDALTPDERTFLEASTAHADAERRAAEERRRMAERQNRRLRRSLVGLALVLVAALLAGGLAINQRRRADRQATLAEEQAVLAASRADEANTQRVAAQSATKAATDAEQQTAIESLVNSSIVLRDTRQDLAALLAAEAYRLAPSAKTRSGLFATFTRNPGFLGYRQVAGTQLFGAVLPLGNGPSALAALTDGSLARLDLDTGVLGEMIGEPPPPGAVTSGAVLSADQRVVIDHFYSDGSFRWQPVDVVSGRSLGPVHEVPNGAVTVAVNGDGSLVAFGESDAGVVAVERVSDGSPAGSFQVAGPSGAPASASVVFDGNDRLFVGSSTGDIFILDTATMQPTASFSGLAYAAQLGMALAPDASYLVAFGTDAVERIDLPSGTLHWSFTGENAKVSFKNVNQSPCWNIAIAAATDRLYCADLFGSLKEYDLATGAQTPNKFDTQVGNTGNLIVTPDGSELVAPSNNTNVIARWRLDGSGPIQRVVAHDNSYATRGYDASGRYLMVGRPSGLPDPFDVDWAVWDPVADRLVDPMDITPIGSWANLPGQLIAGFNASPTGAAIGMYDVATRTCIGALDIALHAGDGIPLPVDDAPHHRFFLSWPNGTIRTFSQDGHEIGPTIHSSSPRGFSSTVSPTPDGTKLVITSLGGFTALVDSDGKPLGPTDSTFWMSTVSSTGVGVASTIDGTLPVFDPSTLVHTGTLDGSRGAAQQMVFSADGSLLMVKGGDRRIALHDMASRLQLGEPIYIDPAAASFPSLRPDGLELAVPNGRSGIVLWDLDAAHWRDAACSLAGRNLTQQEWDTYLSRFGAYHQTCSAWGTTARS